jgi:hypothetical protein
MSRCSSGEHNVLAVNTGYGRALTPATEFWLLFPGGVMMSDGIDEAVSGVAKTATCSGNVSVPNST